jgi:predicted secreted protein
LIDEYWDDDAFAENLGDNDLISPRYGEGGIGYGANYGSVRAAVGGRLSEAYDRYLELCETYFSGYMVDDMALMISWDDLAQFLIDWSVFRISYPRFIEIDTVDSVIRFGLYLYAGCYNLDNTPVIEYDNTLSPEVKASYEKFLSNPASGDVLYCDDIERLYEVWTVNNFEYTQDVQDFIEELEAKLYDTYTGIADSDTVTNVRLGQEVNIVLSENETTPYRWVSVLSDETVMELVNDEYIQDFNPLGADGVGGEHRYDFRAIGVGVCAVDMYLVCIGDTIDEAVQKESYFYKVEEYTKDNEIPNTSIFPKEGIPLLEYLNDKALTTFAEHFDEDFPVSVSVRYDGESSGTPFTVTDPEIIRAVFEALRNIIVVGEWPASGHTDDYLNYYFEMADGRRIYGFEFQDGMLLDARMGLHEIIGFDVLQNVLLDPRL